MRQNRLPRLLGALGLAVSLAGGTFFGTALGATPLLGWGSGPHGDPSISATAATPLSVSPGNVAGFYIWAQNNDSSTLSQFYLNSSSQMKAYGATYVIYYADGTTSGTTTCPIVKGQLACSFGQMKPGDAVYVTAAFTAPPKAGVDTTGNCLPATPGPLQHGVAPTASTYACVDFQWSTTGATTSDKGGNSHGDVWEWFDSVGNDGSGDFAGQFPFCDPNVGCSSSLLSIADSKSLGSSNQQWTSLTAPGQATNSRYGSSALQVADNISIDCTGLTQCGSLTGSGSFVGQFSYISVNSGEDFAPDWIHIQIAMYKVNANQISGVYHLLDDLTTEVLITAQCPDGPTASTPAEGCFSATAFHPGQNTLLDIWTPTNGYLRGY